MAFTGLDLTTFSDALKIIYDPKEVKLQAYKNNPLLAMLPKWEGFGGEAWHIPIWHYTDQGVGATVSDARANQTSSGHEKFTVTARKKKYAVHRIDNETMKASRRDAQAFLSARKVLMDQGVHNLGREMSLAIYRDGSGYRGTVGAYSGGASTFTLANVEDVVHFEVGMELVAASSATGALRDSGNSFTVTAINRTTGVITSDSAIDTQVASFQTGDYVFRKSFAANAGSLKDLTGVAAWLPATVTATTFHGVDRTVDTTRLGGLRYDGSGKTVEDAVLDAGALCFREGARPDYIFGNPVHEVELVKSLGAKATYDPVRSPDGVVGFEALRIRTAAGTVKWISDPNCRPGVAYMLTMNTWKLASLGPAPHLLDEDGLTIRRVDGADEYEVQWGLYAELGCYAPGYNCRITLDT